MKFLIVDDDKSIVEAVSIGLQFQWQDAEVYVGNDGDEGLRLFLDIAPDVTLLDVNMPYMSGFEVLQKIREVSDAPVLMLTARGDEMSKVKGLELGADDYLVKPFSHLELFARIKAVLRRSDLASPVNAAPSFVSGDITVNFDNREVTAKGELVRMTPTEYKLLYQLVRNAGRVLPFDMLLSKVWGDEYRGDMDYLKTYISRLREYGFGFDVGPFSADWKSEDPIRSLARTAAGPLADYALGPGNATVPVENAVRDGWDTAKKYSNEIGDAAVNAYDTVSNRASGAYDTLSNAAGGAYDTVASGLGGAADSATNAASSAWDWLNN